MGHAERPPDAIGRTVFLWTIASALAFAAAAYLLTSWGTR